MTRISDLPQIPQAYGDQIAFNAAVKQILETYQGNVGNKYGLDRVVRFRDIEALDPLKFDKVMSSSATSRITRITGNIIRTGKIESNDSDTYFDLDNDKLVFNGKVSYDSSMPGIFMGNDSGTYKANWGYDASNFLKFDGAKILAKAANFELDADGKITAADATLSGTITATAGAIGGWLVTSNGIADNATENSAKIFLDKTNTKIRVGPSTGYVDIDGDNVRVRSSNYASGGMGSGFSLSSDLLEVGNMACRGIIRTAVFQKSTESALGGCFVVSKGSDVLDSAMTAADNSTLKIEGNETFAVGDFLHAKNDSYEEWLEVTDAGSAPTYTVTRDKKSEYEADSNPAWPKGTTISNYGASGDGLIHMTASESHAPYVSVATHTGEPWSVLQTVARMGNLNGYLGYSSDKYGFAAGADDGYMKYDATNGMRIRGALAATTVTGGTITGATIQTASSGRRILIDEDGMRFITGSSTGKYGTNFKYGDGTQYGDGLLAWFYNTTSGMPFYVHAEQNIADMHLYNRSSDPTGAAEIGDLAFVSGQLKQCTVAGTPGTFGDV